jgi:hypothetical protein
MVGRGRPGDDGRVPVVGVCCGPGCFSGRPLPTIRSFFAMMFKILLRISGQTREAAVMAAKKEATVAAEETGVVVAAVASGNSGYGTSRQHRQWQEQVTAAETEPVVGADDNQSKRSSDSGSNSGSDSAAETVTVAAMAAAVAAAVATEAAMAVAAVTGSNDNGSSGGSSNGGDSGADSGGGGCRCGGDCGGCVLCNSRGR